MTKPARYHLRILALGAVVLAAIITVAYGLTRLPVWVAVTPLLIACAYSIGKFIEAWARKP